MEIREYNEGLSVVVNVHKCSEYDEVKDGQGRLVIHALCEGGWNGTSVDLLDVIQWVKENKPELLKQ